MKNQNFIINTLIISIIIAFNQGILQVVGVPSIIPKLLVFVFALLSFVFLLFSGLRVKLEYVLLIVTYTLVVVVSMIYNSSDIVSSISFLLYTIYAYFIYLIALNTVITKNILARIDRVIVILLILQIFAAVVKIIAVGQREIYVGTISYTGGSINTIYPLLGASFLILRYIFYQKKRLYLLLTLGTLFISYVGEKRGIYFYLPMVLFFIYFINIRLNQSSIFKVKYLKRFVLISILIGLFFYWGVRLSPTLNPEGSKIGSFDIEYVYDYALEYSYRPEDDQLEYSYGRFAGLEKIFLTFWTDPIILRQIIGRGPDEFIGLENAEQKGKEYGLGSTMGVNGFSVYLMSVGILGTIMVIGLYFSTARRLYHKVKLIKNHQNSLELSYMIFGVVGSFIFFLDYLTYTRSFIHTHALNGLLFLCLGLGRNFLRSNE